MRIFTIIVLLFSFELFAQNQPEIKDLKPAGPKQIVHAGDLENHRLDEASGLAYSTRNPNVLWIINDSGSGKQIYACDTRGKDLGGFTVDGSKNRDWEDMASFRYNGKSWLLIADVGDNSEGRKRGYIYFVQEPDLKNDDHRYFLPLYSEMQFTYEDGPRDCEAVAVDAKRGVILLLSKRNVPPVLYELPLDVETRLSQYTAKRLGPVTTIPLPTMEDIRRDPRFGPFGSQPTAMDIAPDGNSLVVLTYLNAFIYDYNTDWKHTLAQLPKHIKIPKLDQPESVCFGPEGKSIYLTSEKRPAPLIFIHP